MMNKVPQICMSLIGASLLLFYGAFFYFQDLKNDDARLANTFANATSMLSSKREYDGPTMVPGDSGFTEERAIIVLLMVAVLISVASWIIASYKRLTVGPYKLFIPLMFGSGAVIGCILFTIYKYGVYQYA